MHVQTRGRRLSHRGRRSAVLEPSSRRGRTSDGWGRYPFAGPRDPEARHRLTAGPRVGAMTRDWDVRAGELSGEAIAGGEPTAWFDRLYAAGAAGEISLPGERDEPQVLLREWADASGLSGAGRR